MTHPPQKPKLNSNFPVSMNPRTHTESNDFEMITGFLQGFVDNEINLNPEETCQRTCTDYQLTRQFGCHNDTFCAQPLKNTRINRCRGYVRDCEFIESDVEICPSVRLENDLIAFCWNILIQFLLTRAHRLST